MANRSDIQTLAALVRDAQKIAVLTGAGMSTESGIPDYRSTDGLYRTLTSEEVFDIDRFNRNPGGFYQVIGPLYCSIVNAAPNAGHRALHELEERFGKSVSVATQNIDGLHQKAGSQRVFEVHGTMDTLTCQGCGKCFGSSEPFLPLFQAGKTVKCDKCGGVLKPDITFYGEGLPEEAFYGAARAFRECDLAIVLGTSLAVYPAAALPAERRAGVPLAIINKTATAADAGARVVLHESIGNALTELLRILAAD